MIEEHLSLIRSKEAESRERVVAAEAESGRARRAGAGERREASRRRASEGGRSRAFAPRRRAAKRRREGVGAPRRERQEARRARRSRQKELRKGDRYDFEGVSRGRLTSPGRAASFRQSGRESNGRRPNAENPARRPLRREGRGHGLSARSGSRRGHRRLARGVPRRNRRGRDGTARAARRQGRRGDTFSRSLRREAVVRRKAARRPDAGLSGGRREGDGGGRRRERRGSLRRIRELDAEDPGRARLEHGSRARARAVAVDREPPRIPRHRALRRPVLDVPRKGFRRRARSGVRGASAHPARRDSPRGREGVRVRHRAARRGRDGGGASQAGRRGPERLRGADRRAGGHHRDAEERRGPRSRRRSPGSRKRRAGSCACAPSFSFCPIISASGTGCSRSSGISIARSARSCSRAGCRRSTSAGSRRSSRSGGATCELFARPPLEGEDPPIQLENRRAAQPFEFIMTLYGRPALRRGRSDAAARAFLRPVLRHVHGRRGVRARARVALCALLLFKIRIQGGMRLLMQILLAGAVLTHRSSGC